jgi:hypothetical protein
MINPAPMERASAARAGRRHSDGRRPRPETALFKECADIVHHRIPDINIIVKKQCDLDETTRPFDASFPVIQPDNMSSSKLGIDAFTMKQIISALGRLLERSPRRTFCLYIKDRRWAVETMLFAEASSHQQIRNLAVAKLRESACHQTVTVWEGLNPLFVVGPEPGQPIFISLPDEENKTDRWDGIAKLDHGVARAHRGAVPVKARASDAIGNLLAA